MSRNRHLWILAAIIAGGAAVRFATLGHQSYDHDETVTVLRVLHPSFVTTMKAVDHLERTPPLYYALAWFWSRLFGTAEVGLRSLSAIFGVLTAPAAYLAARELVSRRAGLIAAAFVAFNPYLIWYSQEARAYALFALFAAWALYFFARALRDSSGRALALWATASVLALCSYYFAVFLIIPEGILLVRSFRPRSRAFAAVAANGAVGLALVPLAVAQEHGGHLDLFTSRPLIDRAGQALLDFVASVEPQPFTGTTAVDMVQVLTGAGIGLIFAWGLVNVARRGLPIERRAAIRVGFIAAASFGLPLALAAAGFDFVEPRKVLIGSVVPLLVLGSIGLGSLEARKVGLAGAMAGAAIFAGVLVAVYVSGQMQRINWRGAANEIGQASQSRVLVVPSSGQVPLAYYLHAKDFRPSTRPREIRVAAIDTLGIRYAADKPAPRFRLVRLERVAGSFWLRRYRAPAPRLITAQAVSGGRVLDEPSLNLFNRVPRPTYAGRRPLGAPRPGGRPGARGSPDGGATRRRAPRAGTAARGCSPRSTRRRSPGARPAARRAGSSTRRPSAATGPA
jgi:hypothetical protein